MPHKNVDARRAYAREYYKRNPQRWIEKNKKRKKEIYKFISEYKRKNGCKLCDENEPVALDFHHINKNKEINLAHAQTRMWGKTRILKEINKCVVLCANCHRKVEAGIIKLSREA